MSTHQIDPHRQISGSMVPQLKTLLHIALLIAGCVTSIGLTGCSGDGKYPVSGKITWDGEPIPADQNGHIMFTPLDPALGPDAGTIGPDGTYELRATPGEKKVEILISRPKGKVVEAMGMSAEEMYIPRKYNEETELTATVETKQNTFDFDLVP